MHSRGTYDDARLILELYEARREERLRSAREWFVARCRPNSLDELTALCPAGSDEHKYFRMVTTYWEMVASFVTAGVLHRELFFQSHRELLLVWLRLQPVIAALRERNADAAAYANLEAVALEYREHMERRSPGSFAAFADRVG